MVDKERIYLGGDWVPGDAGLTEVTSPHDGAPVGRAAMGSVADVDAAVAAARTAFDHGPWPGTPPAERIAAVERFALAYADRADEAAELISRENGSPITFSKLGQVGGIPSLVDGFLAAARTLPWDEVDDGQFGPYEVIREPVGVVAAIAAFNVPHVIMVGKLVPALLAGCTVVVKPSPETALDALLLAEVVEQVGLPEGVVSVVPAGDEASRHLVAHPGVDKVSFTGSTPVGREIGRVCGEAMKRVSLELGGKSAAIVLDDADPARTAQGLRFAAFINNGQACAAQTRVLLPRSRYDEHVDALRDAVASFVVGDPMDPATEVGPLVSRRQQAKVLGFVRSGVEAGARVVVGGDEPLPELDAGCYVRPTLFADVDNHMRIAREEIFGPVVCAIAYDDAGGADDAVRIANDSPYGLAGSVWSKDRRRAAAVARRVRTGMVGINTFGPEPTIPFGGVKLSGVGREYGVEGLKAFTEIKALHGISREDTHA